MDDIDTDLGAAAVLNGIDWVLENDVPLEGRRFGILTNDAARARRRPDVPARGLLQEKLSAEGAASLVRVFSPEHGVRATAPDGEAVGNAVDALTGLPVKSLYGERFAPPPEALADLDAVLFDVPDAGARFYTYLWTLTHLIDACVDAGVRVVVLDRPNPHPDGLIRAEGPLLDLEHCVSFLGRLDIPITHGLTLGELALLWRNERRPNARVDVVTMSGWKRSMRWSETGLPFVAPSPALQTPEAVTLYPGLCLFEAFNVSVGRGTDVSFEAIGAPWMNPEAIVREIVDGREGVSMEGVAFEVIDFTPGIRPYDGERCRGIRFRVTDERAFRPVALGMNLVREIAAVHSEMLTDAPYRTAANPSGAQHLDLLVGQVDAAMTLRRASPSQIRKLTSVEGWLARVRPIMLYD